MNDTPHGRTDSGQPIVFLAGERVALGPLRRDLLPLYARWNNDAAVLGPRGMPVRPRTMEREEAWFDRVASTEAEVFFTMYLRDDLRPIGMTMLFDIQWPDRTAEFGIFIGEEDCRDKGYGTEATLLTLDQAFTGLGLENVLLRVFSFNERAIRAYTRAGFRMIGRRRGSGRVGGRTWDDVYMDCIASEFKSPVLAALLGLPDAAPSPTPAR